jgi:hypothetical protein
MQLAIMRLSCKQSSNSEVPFKFALETGSTLHVPC